ncbi:hypothetical protein [Sphingomonas sp. LY160]|uniref:hypothetical protein n=1 Tax=Sphingomonas sp. LY160 TaxID=3095342 RepID=UPI002ADEC33D|nr:hypothetical protein [Sphingomonas sp. LY160]MEA1073262.1 hypothetical protein [Sphingomonas sp. LY160]
MRRNHQLMLGGSALLAALSLPGHAQDRPESLLPPAAQAPTPAPTPSPTPSPSPTTNETAPAVQPSSPSTPSSGARIGTQVVDETNDPFEELAAQPVPQVEYPARARRDASRAGIFMPEDAGLPAAPWGAASGRSLSIVMRGIKTPIASRWAHIALRNTLLASAPAPRDVNPVDWAAERAWLLLRMGEADGGRLLVAGVDGDRFTPKMQQVAIQSALATSDPAAMCPHDSGLSKVEPRVAGLVTAICAAFSGEAERAAADIDVARRRGRLSPIDLSLADKVVGAGAETARAVTIEWEPVDRLNAWRYGLSTATAMMPPKRLIDSATPTTQAWLARAPMFSALDRLPAARTAAGLGVLSSQALIDLYAAAYDATDPDSLGQTDAWQVRLAFIGKDQDARLAAMRKLWGVGQGDLDRYANRVLVSRAARRIRPSADLETDAVELVESLLAGGFDREAARWIPVVDDLDDAAGDKLWAMLALGAADPTGLEIDAGRIESFADRDTSQGKVRTGLLVAGLAGLGRIDAATAGQLNREYRLGLGAQTNWTRLIDGAMQRRQTGTSILLSASALRGRDFGAVAPVYQFHAINALRVTGQEYLARMVAAEALART